MLMEKRLMPDHQFNRKLTAILSADVEGYSRLMSLDETETVITLKACRTIISRLIMQHHGRVIDSPGDNLLAEFASVVDAVECALEIQDELKTSNDGLPADRQMVFRIGINLVNQGKVNLKFGIPVIRSLTIR
jgi:adenylate cyclase